MANFIGDINKLDSQITSSMNLSEGQNHFIRLERIRVERDSESGFEGIIESQEYYGLYIKYYIKACGQVLSVNIYEPGEKVRVIINPADIMSYDKAVAES